MILSEAKDLTIVPHAPLAENQQGILPVHWSQRDDLIKGFVKGHGFSRAASATNNAGFSP